MKGKANRGDNSGIKVGTDKSGKVKKQMLLYFFLI